MSPRGRQPSAASGSGADNRPPDLIFVEPELEQPDDPMAWSGWQPPMPPGPSVLVTAVLVAHDGAVFLPRTLDAIEAQTRRPDRLVAVDTGSADTSPEMLAIATADLVRLPPGTGFGAAVAAALTAAGGFARSVRNPASVAISGALGVPDPGGPVEWLWLLHDDAAPEPDALQRLVEAIDTGPSIGIAGCKQVSWSDRRRLLDVGFTTSRLGARVTGVDVDDFDQGQLDHRSDVLAVDTAGMLVRRDLWERLGGPDPALRDARIDLDLCRRAHLLGERVVVVPRAVVAHAEATASGLRGPQPGRDPARAGAVWARRDRRAAVHLRLASVALPLVPFLLVWLGAAAVARALARLCLRQPDRALGEISAYLLAVFWPPAWILARRRGRRGRRMSRREYRRLLAGTRQALRQRRDRISSYLRVQDELWADPPEAEAEAEPVTGVTGHPARRPPGPLPLRTGPDGTASEPAGFDRPDPGPPPPSLRYGLLVALLTGVTGLVAVRLLLSGSGVAVGAGLVPLPADPSTLWDLGRGGWRPVGLGLAAVGDPFDLVLAGLSWLLAGSTRAASETLLIGALPLASLSAWWASSVLTRSRALRAWAALVWAAAPSLLLAVTSGRLGAIVAHLMLPVTALALIRAVTPDRATRRGSRPAAAAAGLALTVLLAAAPALTLPALGVLMLLLIVARAGRLLLLGTGLVPAVLLAPWWQAVVQDPRLLLAEPGGASASTAAPGWAALLWPSDPAVVDHGPVRRVAEALTDLSGIGDAGLWLRALAIAVVAPALLLGLMALTGRRRRIAALAWGVAVGALLTAVAVVVIGARPVADATVHGWAGPAVSIVLLAVLTAALVHLDGAAGRLRARSIGLRHWNAVALGVLAVLAPLVLLGGWAADGWTAGPGRWVHRADPEVLPGVAAAEADSPAAARTLTLQPTADGVRWNLYRTAGPQTGQESAASLTPAALAERATVDRPVLTVIGALLAGSGQEQRERFADLDIGSILVLTGAPADAVATDAAIAALDTAPGLVRVSNGGGRVLWRVELAATGSDSDSDTDIASGKDADSAGSPSAEQDDTGAGGEVPTRPARVRVLNQDGDLLTTVPSTGVGIEAQIEAGDDGRLLVLSEHTDVGWNATVDATALEPVTYHGWAQAFRLPADGGVLVVRHTSPGVGPWGLAAAGMLVLALLATVPLPRGRLRLPPTRSWRGHHVVQLPVGSSGRRARSPEQPAADLGAGPQDQADDYARHQARISELARRLAIEAADAADPTAGRPSRRRRRAARRAAEAMAAEAGSAGESANGEPVGWDQPERDRPGRDRPGREPAGPEAIGSEAIPGRTHAAWPVIDPDQPGLVTGSGTAGVRPGTSVPWGAADLRDRTDADSSADVGKASATGKAPAAGQASAVGDVSVGDVPVSDDGIGGVRPADAAEQTGPVGAGSGRAVRPLRPGVRRSLPPGPRSSLENRPQADPSARALEPDRSPTSGGSSEAMPGKDFPAPGDPDPMGDSGPSESAPKTAGPAESASDVTGNGDAAGATEQGETAGESARQRGRERGREAGRPAPVAPGEEESS